ncbi:MAG TPA: hypothetical protein VML96_04330 [Egibacteraceae bacterium]|nr:hypothetical protein [Egibacteraceae bacterium]
MSSESLNELARAAADPNRDALTVLIAQIRDPVYRMGPASAG